MLDYENLKTELQTISSNIDSRNEDLEQLRVRYNLNIEKKGQFKKSREDLMMEIEELNKAFGEKKRKEQDMRWQLNNTNAQKELLRLELDKLTQKSQLLSKTPLLRRFDSMEDGIENVNQEIQKFEGKQSKIMKKIESMEVKVNRQKSHESDLKELDAFIASEKQKLEKFFKPTVERKTL